MKLGAIYTHCQIHVIINVRQNGENRKTKGLKLGRSKLTYLWTLYARLAVYIILTYDIKKLCAKEFSVQCDKVRESYERQGVS